MFFENFYEQIGSFDQSVIQDFRTKLFGVDLSDPKLARPEYCFADGGKLIMPMHFAQVRDAEYYEYVKPLIELAKNTQHSCLRNTTPFRIEISIIEPGKSVLWHHDQHMFHKYSERIHFPIITNNNVEFIGKWFLSNQAYSYKMLPGKIYRFNNRCMHTVKNQHDSFRCHVMIDFIHDNVLNTLIKRGTVDTLKNNVAVTPIDEIYYYVNTKPYGVSEIALTDDDIEQLKTLKNYDSVSTAAKSSAENTTSDSATSSVKTPEDNVTDSANAKTNVSNIQDALVKELSNLDHYDISQKLPDLINAQVFRLTSNSVFRGEANHIAATCEQNNLDRIVDFGCWVGALAAEVFETGIKLRNYHLIDAVPTYMTMAKNLLSDKPISSQEILLLPSSYKSDAPKSILIHPYDTLNSTSIYSDRFLPEKIKTLNISVPVAHSCKSEEFVMNNRELFAADTYVKIDIDGVDIDLVTSIIKQGLRPGAIQFEVWNTFKTSYSKLLPQLKEIGYLVPDINLNVHQSFSVGVSKNYWWAVGYDPDKNFKIEVTYYNYKS